MVYTSIKELIKSILNELKCAIKEYAEKQEAALKIQLRKILYLTITGAILLVLAITLAGTAALFLLIGSLRYLQTFLPTWQAWLVMAAASALIAAILFLTLYYLVKRLFTTPMAKQE